jgi:hypothetical protein
MTSFPRAGLLIVALLACVAAGLYQIHPWWFRQFFVADARTHADIRVVVADASTHADIRANPAKFPDHFSPDELKPFLEAAAKAEAIDDPLQRCLSYPDPPGSNWSRVVVEAYCHYYALQIPKQAELVDLIRKGHAEELDRRLSDAVHQEQTDPHSRGLIDRIYYADFVSGAPELRSAIKSWKKQRPQSAFAYAASASATVQAGADVRGGRYASDTPESAVADMHRLLDIADADIAAALRLDPTLTPTYSTMLVSRRLGGDRRRLREAVSKALRAAPANFAIYTEIMESAKPKWYGSSNAMKQVALDAGAQSERNPLLLLLLPEPEADAANLCGCDERTNPADYRKVFDQIAQRATMTYAVVSAEQINHHDFAVVYRSEALRFTTNPIRDHSDRLDHLVHFNRIPKLRDAVRHLIRNDADYIAQASSDLDLLNSAGVAAGTIGLWDQAWAISEKLIQMHPEEPDGWAIRAEIQQEQPRPGLKETAAYLVQHFSDNPRAQDAVVQARQELGLPPERKAP